MKAAIYSHALVLLLALSAYPAFGQYRLYKEGLESYNKKDYPASISKLTEFLESSSREKKFDVECYYVRGMSYFKINDFNHASPDLEKAIQLGHPNKVSIHWLIARCYKEQGFAQNSIVQYTRAFELVTSPKDQVQILYERSQVHRMINDSGAEYADLQLAFRIEPSNTLIKQALGQEQTAVSLPANTTVVTAPASSDLSNASRVALVIGVKSYKHVSPLQNTLNDAMDMAVTLRSKGFLVIELFEPQTKRDLQDGVIKYFKLLSEKPNAAGLLFYSGHGMQVDGTNYLIPAAANPKIKADLNDQCLNMDYVMQAIEEAGNGLNIFILDACRNNPFRGFYRSGEEGLRMVNTPKGSYIVYATKPGSVASDGVGRNGLFTSKLLKYVNEPDMNIEQVFKKVANEVATESGDRQRPWIASDYTGDFYFTKRE